MSLQNIFSEIEKADPEVYDRMDTRRDAMKRFSSFAGKAALATLPMALGAMFKKAYGQTPQADVANTLQYALTLEYLEYRFYQQGVAGTGVQTTASPAALAALTKIRDHEQAHVNYLKAVISAIGFTPISEPTFDFTGGNGSGTGPFVGWNTNYDIFLAMAQTFEDTGVRAYKGAVGNLVSNKEVLTAALNIHSVEARHASHLRQMRRARGVATGSPVYVTPIKPWILQAQSNIGAPYNTGVQPNYAGEDASVQLGVNVAGVSGVSADAATASFDEPLSMASVTTIVDPFIV